MQSEMRKWLPNAKQEPNRFILFLKKFQKVLLSHFQIYLVRDAKNIHFYDI